MAKILVVDDKEMMRDSVATILGRRGHAVVSAANGEMAVAKLMEKKPDAVVTDLQMPGMSGIELLAEIRKVDEDLPVILMTAYASVATAVEAMREGAFDYVTKPFSGDELAIAVDRAIEHGMLRKENQMLRAAAAPAGRETGGHDMVGAGPVMTDLRNHLARIADSHGTVLISGESGTGKEVAAQAIHAASPRANAPFLAINCAALSASLLESELFGHEKGAFTGPISSARVVSNSPTEERFFLTRSVRFRPSFRRSCFESCRNGRSSGWARVRPRLSTCGLWRPQIVISHPRWTPVGSGATSSSGLTCSPSRCRRFGSGPKTSRPCRPTSSSRSRLEKVARRKG